MKTVLFVDDSKIVRKKLCTALQGKYNVYQAGNGEEGLHIALRENIDLFIIDYYMPQMDGITLIETLRALKKYSTTSMIVLTTESSTEIRDKGKKAGANGWLVKPCEPEKLLKVVEKWI